MRPSRPTHAIEDRFWDCFFDNITFTLAHSETDLKIAAVPSNTLQINFSYQTEPPDSLHGSRLYGLGRVSKGPPIPNDVLMVRPDVLEQIERQFRTSAEMTGPSPGGGPTYTSARPYNPGLHETFEARIVKLLGNPALESRFLQWYAQSRYDFSVRDIINFLRQDQEISDSPHLSLVLPGGGVKSAYQAQLLDHLYAGHFLTNSGFQDSGQGPLVVSDVVGTSGGAMVGLFTAQKREAGDERSLLGLWEPGPKVFPPFDILRWTSLYIILLLFFLIFYVARIMSLLNLGRTHERISPYRTSYWLLFVFLAILLGGPFLVVWLLGGAEQTEMPWSEELLYLLTILAVYIGMSCCIDDPSAHAKATATRFPAPSTIALLLASAGIVVGLVAKSSLAASAGLLATVIGLILLARERKLGLRLAGIGDCARALSLLGLVIAISYALFGLLALSGWSTSIELTKEFWLTLLLSAFAISIVCFVVTQWGNRSLKRYAYRGTLYFGTVHRIGRIRAERAQTLTVLFGMGLLWWNCTAAPAIYGGTQAYKVFKGNVQSYSQRSSLGKPGVYLQTNLIVTATALNDIKNVIRVSGTEKRLPLPAGDVYFCFPGPSPNSCPKAVQSKRWFEIVDHSIPEVADPVFASGSPFPVFPPHEVQWHIPGVSGPSTVKARLIDGGYAHNVPLQAAALAGARQVLVLRAEPFKPPAPSRPEFFPSQLARYAGLLLPFLYERAQEIDRSVARGLVVASFSPYYAEDRKIPLLTDFDSATIRDMLRYADDDFKLDRRIGLVESWGLPVVFRQIRRIEDGKTKTQDMFELAGPGY